MFLLLTYNMETPEKGYFERCHTLKDLMTLSQLEYGAEIGHKISNWAYKLHKSGDMFTNNSIPLVVVIISYDVYDLKEGEVIVNCDEP